MIIYILDMLLIKKLINQVMDNSNSLVKLLDIVNTIYKMIEYISLVVWSLFNSIYFMKHPRDTFKIEDSKIVTVCAFFELVNILIKQYIGQYVKNIYGYELISCIEITMLFIMLLANTIHTLMILKIMNDNNGFNIHNYFLYLCGLPFVYYICVFIYLIP